MIRNRKFILFLVSLAAVVVLSILGVDTNSVIGLFAIYCTGNISAKLSGKFTRDEHKM